MKKHVRSFSACLGLALALFTVFAARAQDNKRVVLQAFWWDFKNNNYPQGWANYLADLAPRLRAMGIDAVWVPVNVKNANPQSVGYSPFDHYDLGDKYQKNNLKTPFGDKDEFLRMVAVMHANGIEVIEDVVLNHMDGAGSGTGAGAIDPAYTTFYNSLNLGNDPTAGYKHFRYACFSTPVGDESATDYLNRKGRWPKNWQNFFPNPSDRRATGEDLTTTSFGPDIGFNDGSYGTTSLGGYNPTQTATYMRNQGRAWMTWMKKQTGIDGYRFDAVKHFPPYVVEDYLWNMQNNAGFASGGNELLAVGEWVGSKSEIDSWTDNVQGRAGTFDFSIRGFSGGPGLYGMVYGNGNYDIGNLPGQQQDRRYRTFPFVNNHDTFRPNLAANGNYGTTWGSELAPHVDPREPRLAAAYAVMLAMDGNPCVFFEDLFDIGTTGKRYTHLPNDTADLPTRSDIKNLIMCHNKLNFKGGAYLVPHQSADYLIIERSGKAIIGITDNWTTWQAQTIQTQFAPGTRLIDYGNSSPTSDVRTVDNNGRVQISTPPCNGTARRRGYSVWAPVGININAAISQTPVATAQEWEMDDDLGDSHPRSLQQGGRLPANSMAARTAGKIYPRTGPLTLDAFLSDTSQRIRLILADRCGNGIDSIEGRGSSIQLTYNIPAIAWYTIKVRNASAANAGQKVWVKATYTGPVVLDARGTPSFVPVVTDLGQDRPICQGSVLSGGGGTGINYLWTDSAGNTIATGAGYTVQNAGLYILTKTSQASGCTSTDTVRITQVYPQPALPVIRQSNDTLLIDPVAGYTYQWYRGSTLLSGATDYRYRPTQAGNYSVQVTSADGCTRRATAFNYVVSVRHRAEFALGVRPNPARSQAQWVASGLKGLQVQYRLLDLSGRVLISGQSEVRNGEASATLSLGALPAGVYRVEVQAEDGVKGMPLIVE